MLLDTEPSLRPNILLTIVLGGFLFPHGVFADVYSFVVLDTRSRLALIWYLAETGLELLSFLFFAVGGRGGRVARGGGDGTAATCSPSGAVLCFLPLTFAYFIWPTSGLLTFLFFQMLIPYLVLPLFLQSYYSTFMTLMWARIFCTLRNVLLSTLSLKGCCVSALLFEISSSRLMQLDSKLWIGFQPIDWPWY